MHHSLRIVIAWNCLKGCYTFIYLSGIFLQLQIVKNGFPAYSLFFCKSIVLQKYANNKYKSVVIREEIKLRDNCGGLLANSVILQVEICHRAIENSTTHKKRIKENVPGYFTRRLIFSYQR